MGETVNNILCPNCGAPGNGVGCGYCGSISHEKNRDPQAASIDAHYQRLQDTMFAGKPVVLETRQGKFVAERVLKTVWPGFKIDPEVKEVRLSFASMAVDLMSVARGGNDCEQGEWFTYGIEDVEDFETIDNGDGYGGYWNMPLGTYHKDTVTREAFHGNASSLNRMLSNYWEKDVTAELSKCVANERTLARVNITGGTQEITIYPMTPDVVAGVSHVYEQLSNVEMGFSLPLINQLAGINQ